MAVIGYEWLIVVGLLVVLFLWGPKKLPELAKSLGLAKKEFEKTRTELSSLTDVSTPTESEPPKDPLIAAAGSLGMSTKGKTREQLAKEIAEQTSKNPAA